MTDGKTLASEMVASVARDPLRRADTAGNVLDIRIRRLRRS